MYLHPPPANFNKEILDAGTHADLPADFDCRRFPILAAHWFGWRSLGEVVASVVVGIQSDHRIEARRSGA